MAEPELPLFGLPDELFEQRRPRADGTGGLITKREVRAISLARLGLQENSLVWDIGTGSGAVAIEAARLCRAGQVFAVEKNSADIAICQRNLARFSCQNVTLVEGNAPAACQNWPAPDAVFVGGSGGYLPEIIGLVAERLRPAGRLVLNLATLESLQQALNELAKWQFETDLTLAQISHSRPILNLTRLEALNPVFILAAKRN